MPNSHNGTITKIAWNFTAVNDSLTEVFVYDAIADKQSFDWWTGEKGAEITPKLFTQELNKVTTPELCVRINSGGGDVFAAEAIRTQIREKRANGKKITCKIDGLCASAAVGIAAACESISIPSSAWFMIHDPTAYVHGRYSADDFEKEKAMLDKVKEGIINTYSEKTGKDKKEISDLMTAETWYTGEDAVKAGFCDNLLFEETTGKETEPPAISNVFNAAIYRNCPKELLNSRILPAAVKHTSNKNKKGVENNVEEIKTVDQLKAAYPELTAQLADTATAAERKRIQDIEEIALPGYEEIINKAKYEAPANADNVARQIIAAQKAQGAAYLAGVNEDVNESGANQVVSQSHEGTKDVSDPYGAVIDKVLPGIK